MWGGGTTRVRKGGGVQAKRKKQRKKKERKRIKKEKRRRRRMASIGHQIIRIGPTGDVLQMGLLKFPRAPSRSLSHQMGLRPPKTK